MFSQADLLQIQSKGITINQVTAQLERFEKGFAFLNVVSPAIYENGIFSLSQEQVKTFGESFEKLKKNYSIGKFVPASGAATRMFKSLYEFLAKPEVMTDEVEKFINNIELFAFHTDLKNRFIEKGISPENPNPLQLVEILLLPSGLNYGNLPKGLIKFHKYNNKSRVAIEEHLVEGALYASTLDNIVSIHFTLSPEHIAPFTQLIQFVTKEYEEKFKVKYQISYSIQKPSTDTIAADNHNKPFRDTNGSLVFRPGGHGALLENLNEQISDIIFIKNIDNVVPDRIKQVTIDYKKALAGLLIETSLKIKEYMEYLHSEGSDNNLKNKEIMNFIENNLGYKFPDSFLNLTVDDKKNVLAKILNRPLRVCGMVKNSGEPGGGPFWVRSSDGSLSLQILESSQFDFDNEEQREVFKKATHFNPVDLVIFTKDYAGNKFDLKQFVDPETGFISIKSKDGKELKALELPGLWNGAMAKWNTLFVEVPLITFNPVKTVIDLLRPEHLE